MSEIIKIKCPFDGAVLSVYNQPGLESKNVTCPICKRTYPFKEFKRVDNVGSPQSDPDTELPGRNDPPTSYPGQNAADGKTQVNWGNTPLGELVVAGSTQRYQLRQGRNVVGRKASNSSADFQIETGDKRSMSREHLVIEAKVVPGKGFVHYVSLFKEKVNKTVINSDQLYPGDRLVLNHGDVIKLPDANVRFVIPDSESTEYQSNN